MTLLMSRRQGAHSMKGARACPREMPRRRRGASEDRAAEVVVQPGDPEPLQLPIGLAGGVEILGRDAGGCERCRMPLEQGAALPAHVDALGREPYPVRPAAVGPALLHQLACHGPTAAVKGKVVAEDL